MSPTVGADATAAAATFAPTAATTAATAVPTGTLDASSLPVGLTVITHDSFNVSQDVLAVFEIEHGYRVRFLQAGDAGTLANKIVLSKGNPLADVVYGIDNTFLSRVLGGDPTETGVLESYDAAALAAIPERFQLDPAQRALPVDYGDVCPNYDKQALTDAGVDPPLDLEDLTKPAYRGMLVVENPATSSPGLAFLLATVGHFGEDGYLDYWRDLVANDVKVVNDWETAYNQEFSRAGGDRPIVISYGSSPPFELLYADIPPPEPPTAAVTANESCFRQIEFAGILRGTAHRAAAEAWIDFMLSAKFQEDIPLQMFVFPVNPQAQLADVFQQYMEIPARTADVSPESIAKNREAWVDAWTGVVLGR